jgi:hypothetical protein
VKYPNPLFLTVFAESPFYTLSRKSPLAFPYYRHVFGPSNVRGSLMALIQGIPTPIAAKIEQSKKVWNKSFLSGPFCITPRQDVNSRNFACLMRRMRDKNMAKLTMRSTHDSRSLLLLRMR